MLGEGKVNIFNPQQDFSLSVTSSHIMWLQCNTVNILIANLPNIKHENKTNPKHRKSSNKASPLLPAPPTVYESMT